MEKPAGGTPIDGVPLIPISSGDGSATFRLGAWSEFYAFLESDLFKSDGLPRSPYIWRGQRRSDWALGTTLDRLFGKLGHLSKQAEQLEREAQAHLTSFRYAARGRRGPHPEQLTDIEWWALGQHFGLATPLLDWTRSPFAAAYFAFEGISQDATEYRAVYALHQDAVFRKSASLVGSDEEQGSRLPIIEFIEPLSDENARLVSQSGLFSRAPIGTSIENWIANAFEDSEEHVLIKIEIPNRDRTNCLRSLERMNINHLSLFPDLMGASRFTNLSLELRS
jgi:hypothetical protein